MGERTASGSAYDAIAGWYDAWVGDRLGDDPYWTATEPLLGEVTGKRVLDLACGQGRIARRLADLGADVVAVDHSAGLLAIARRHEAAHPRGIAYHLADARRLDAVAALDPAGEPFDGAVCFMALMDIAELAPPLQGVARRLRPGGWFVFALLHPCFHTARSGELDTAQGTVRTVGAYFAEGYWRAPERTGPPGRVGAYHRRLSTLVNTLAGAGLVLEHLVEPAASGAVATARPVWAEVPAVLAGRCRLTV
jgi:ubiquinone/menaquinone biosynthesis C-methylase UbiE